MKLKVEMKRKEESIQNLIDNFKLLNILSDNKVKKRYRDSILKNADSKLIKAIEESVQNLLRGNSKYSNSDLDKLGKYKYTLRKLIKPSNIKHKRKILIQKGGFLQVLLPAIITGLSTIIEGIISKQL